MKKSKTILESYNKISKWYDEHRSHKLFEKAWLDKAIVLLKPKESKFYSRYKGFKHCAINILNTP